MLIEHTGSLSSLGTNNKHDSPSLKSQRDTLRNTLSFCTNYGKSRSLSSPKPYVVGSNLNNDVNGSMGSPVRMEATAQKHVEQICLLRPKSFYEWTIPYEKIELGDIEAASPKGPVYRGRWHGDVMFYTRSHETQDEIDDFHEEVALLGMIRHENIVLFMGACIQPPNLAVVTSVGKGYTLHTHLHLRKTAFHFGSKFSIAKQVAQGLSYLHAKGITLGKLCSRNIFLESKVKIGITDYMMNTSPTVKSGYGCIPKGHLTYISPELMKTLRVRGLYLTPSEKASQKCDVYAYGTLIYEIFLSRYPFKDTTASAIIWKIASGFIPSLEETEFPSAFKSLIQSCWSYDGEGRPEFHEILANMRKFNIPRSLQKKLSSSDSDAINKQHILSSPFHRLHGSPAHARWKKPC